MESIFLILQNIAGASIKHLNIFPLQKFCTCSKIMLCIIYWFRFCHSKIILPFPNMRIKIIHFRPLLFIEFFCRRDAFLLCKFIASDTVQQKSTDRPKRMQIHLKSCSACPFFPLSLSLRFIFSTAFDNKTIIVHQLILRKKKCNSPRLFSQDHLNALYFMFKKKKIEATVTVLVMRCLA